MTPGSRCWAIREDGANEMTMLPWALLGTRRNLIGEMGVKLRANERLLYAGRQAGRWRCWHVLHLRCFVHKKMYLSIIMIYSTYLHEIPIVAFFIG